MTLELDREIAKIINPNYRIEFIDYAGTGDESAFQKSIDVDRWKQAGNSSMMVGWHLIDTSSSDPSLELNGYREYSNDNEPFSFGEFAEFLLSKGIILMPTDIKLVYEYILELRKNEEI